MKKEITINIEWFQHLKELVEDLPLYDYTGKNEKLHFLKGYVASLDTQIEQN